MFRRVISTIRHLNYHPTGFDSYFSNLQLHSTAGGPNFEEAKKDFRSAIHLENSGLMG